MKWRDLNKSYSDIIEQYKKQTPYEILKINESATVDDIKKAYKRLVKIYHPDKSDIFMRKVNEETIKLINVAYEKLINERK